MKKIFLLLLIGLFACQSDDDQPVTPQKSVKVTFETTASERELVGCAKVQESSLHSGNALFKITPTTKNCPVAEKDKGKIRFLNNQYIQIHYDGLFIPRMELNITKDRHVRDDITKTHIIFLKFKSLSDIAKLQIGGSVYFTKYATDLNYREYVEDRKNVEVSFDENKQTVEAPEFTVNEGNIIVILQELFPFKVRGLGTAYVRSTITGTSKFYKVDEEKVGTGD